MWSFVNIQQRLVVKIVTQMWECVEQEITKIDWNIHRIRTLNFLLKKYKQINTIVS